MVEAAREYIDSRPSEFPPDLGTRPNAGAGAGADVSSSGKRFLGQHALRRAGCMPAFVLALEPL